MNPDYLTAEVFLRDVPLASGSLCVMPPLKPVAMRSATKPGPRRSTSQTPEFDIETGSQAGLRKIAKIVKDDCGNVVIEIDGHTDNTGDPTSNQTLSQLRAKSVVDFLIREGVNAAKLKAVGFGQERPIAPNETLEGRRLNRRIEFLVTSARLLGDAGQERK